MRKRILQKAFGRITPVFLLGLVMLALTAAPSAQASIGIVVTIAPEPLPVYEQPYCPGPSYIWAPGYWAWGPDGYFWVPGTWVLAPFQGALWTPGYWAWDPDDGGYIWREGYWGPVVGFYGGINYGYGYTGRGYEGGYWRNGAFFYNRAVNNVNTTNITNVYNKTVINNVTVNNVSYNGGNRGTTARATGAEMAAEHGRRVPPTAEQRRHVEVARAEPAQLASRNHGRPQIAATPQPGVLRGQGVVRASGGGIPAGGPKGEAQPNGGLHPFQTKPQETQKPAPQSNGNWRTFSQPNSGRGEKSPASMRRAAPEPNGAVGHPEHQGRMEQAPPASGRTGTRETPRPQNKPEDPRGEKPNKSEKRQPPPERGRSNVGANPTIVSHPSARTELSRRSGVRPPITEGRSVKVPEPNARQAATPDRQTPVVQARPNPAHASTGEQTKRHPPTEGR